MRKLIGTIVVISVLVASVGYYRGWFSIARTGRAGSDHVGVGVSIDRSKAKDDVAQAGDKLREMTQPATPERAPATRDTTPEGGEKVSGKIVNLDPAGSLTVATDDGRSLQILVPDVAGVTVDGRDATSAGLRSGDRVVIHYRSAEGRNIASELSVTTRPS